MLLADGRTVNPGEVVFSRKDLATTMLKYGSVNRSQLLQIQEHFAQVYSWEIGGEVHYLYVSLPMKDLIHVQNQTLVSLVLIFFLTAVIAIAFGVFWINTLITKPLRHLARQASINSKKAYPRFDVASGDDDISVLGNVLNHMVNTIQARSEELEQTTRQLKNAQALAKIGNWQLDHKTNEMQWSEEIYHILELERSITKPDAILVQQRIHPDDVEMVNSAFNRSMQTKLPFDVTHRIVLGDNTKYVRVYTETRFNTKDEPAITLGTMQDVSEQMLKDQQLRHNQKLDSLGQLTGGIAHDFNNMLGVILGYSELLQQQLSGNEKWVNNVGQIYQAADRARKLTAKLLAFSRDHATTAGRALINDILSEQKHMLEKTLTVRIQLELQLGTGLWPVWLDKDELEDAVVNMSINAMHAMADGGHLTISTGNTHLARETAMSLGIEPGDYVLLELKDNGVGMDQTTLQRIFEPFFSTKEESGTGLGMSQVYGFVKRSNGAIKVNSIRHHGTHIEIYFPRYQRMDEGEVVDAATTTSEDLSGEGTILVVDDEPSLVYLEEVILSTNGYRVLTAQGGLQALDILAREHVDLMLSDVLMPEMDGYYLAKVVREKYPEVKIQMISGYTGKLSDNSADRELHQQRLQKPVNSDILLRRVKHLLH
ncbi:MAG: response regulator [Gammaproteobacteria bacterium]|nr:response regulator [Gammaproteobacteria bacterium]MDH5801381.1 response regulator [Gammaproteobacteria bacterium]